MIVYAGAGLLFLFFIILVVMAAKRWRAAHVTAVVLVFLAAFSAIFMAASALKTELVWRKLVDQRRAELAQLQAEERELRLGSLTEVEQKQDSVRSLKSALDRELLFRGRVWRGARPTPGPNQTVTLTIGGQPEPEGQPPKHNIQPDTILFAFQEQDNPQTGIKQPRFYLGEYVVTNATDTTITVRPTLPLDRLQQQRVSQANNSWSVYEVMPVDRHMVWTDREPDEGHLFGEFRPEYANLLQQAQVPQEVIDEYQRDGTPARPDDPPERRWLKVEFLQDHAIVVDAEDDPQLFTNEMFDALGRAKLARLRQGSPTQFKEGDHAYFDLVFAQDLIDREIAKKSDNPQAKPVGPVNDVFVRELRNYEQHFHILFRRETVLASAIETLKRDTQSVDDSRKKIEAQVAYRTQEKQNLQQDREKLNYEREQLAQHKQALEQQRTALLSRLSNLYQENLALEEELTRMQQTAQRIIDRRTVEAGRVSQRSAQAESAVTAGETRR